MPSSSSSAALRFFTRRLTWMISGGMDILERLWRRLLGMGICSRSQQDSREFRAGMVGQCAEAEAM